MGSRYIVLPEEMSPKSHKALIIISISLFKAPGIILHFFVLCGMVKLYSDCLYFIVHYNSLSNSHKVLL